MQKGSNLQLVADFTISGDREIYGVAHVPTIDRENELILSEAIRNALPEYMKLPILHVQHTERPVGTVTKALVDDQGKLHLWGKIKATPDTDDVWEDISAGNLNKFSIFGKRLNGTPECSLSPNQRVSPCVTKALTLFSISVVGDNAMNEETFLKVAKAFDKKGDDHTPVGKYESMSSCMEANSDKDSPGGYCASIEHRATGKWPAEKADMDEKDEKKEDKEEKVEKSEDSGLVHDSRNLSSIMDRLDGVEKSVAALYEMANPVEKSEDKEDDTMEEKKEETVEKCSDTPVKKAGDVEVPVIPEVKPEVITKADLSGFITKAELDVITKAYDDLKSRVDKMEKETIEKGGNVVIIQAPDYSKDNPMLGNMDAIGA